jgi:hypothetical protein
MSRHGFSTAVLLILLAGRWSYAEVINRTYKEGIRQLSALVKTKPHWPEIVLLHYDEPTERLMPEATLRYKPAEYSQFLAGLPQGRDVDAFPPGQNGPYAALPSYHKLTEFRAKLAAWIEQLRSDSVDGHSAGDSR